MSVIKKISPDTPDVVVAPKEDFEMPELKVVLPKEEFRPFCPHDRIKVFEFHRIVECNNCGARLDAFDYLLTIGKRENNKLSELKWLNSEIKYRKEETEKLKKEISKLSSIIRKTKSGN